MSTSVVDPIIAQLDGLPTATLCDAFLKLGERPAERLVMRRLRPLGSLQTRAVGRARTQQLESLRDASAGSVVTNRTLHFELVDGAQPGDMLVIAVAGPDHLASFGDVLAMKAQHQGVAGVVVDGAVRDAAYIERIELSLWCDGITMIPQGYGGYSVVSVNETVTCAGVQVNPGDFIVADSDGVIVVPADEAERVIALAEELEAAEEHAREGIRNGTALAQLYPSRDYYRRDADDS